jgi:hypothetical protein
MHASFGWIRIGDRQPDRKVESDQHTTVWYQWAQSIDKAPQLADRAGHIQEIRRVNFPRDAIPALARTGAPVRVAYNNGQTVEAADRPHRCENHYSTKLTDIEAGVIE